MIYSKIKRFFSKEETTEDYLISLKGNYSMLLKALDNKEIMLSEQISSETSKGYNIYEHSTYKTIYDDEIDNNFISFGNWLDITSSAYSTVYLYLINGVPTFTCNPNIGSCHVPVTMIFSTYADRVGKERERLDNKCTKYHYFFEKYITNNAENIDIQHRSNFLLLKEKD